MDEVKSNPKKKNLKLKLRYFHQNEKKNQKY